MSQDQSSTAPSAGVDDSNPSSMNDMFALLLGEINNLKASMATLHEGRSETGEAERVEGEGVVEGETNDDDNWPWLAEELREQMRADDETDRLSLDTRVNNLILSQQKPPHPDLLSNIAQDLAVEDKTGQPVNDALAAIVTSLLKERLADEKLQDKLKKYLRPANVEFLKTPRVNPLIWGQISAGTRAGDAKSQKIQHVLIGAVSAIVRATEYVLNKGGDQDLLTMLTDSVAFMLQCNHDHNHSRRLAMKKDLHKDFAALCNVHMPSGDYLFGDLSKATKEITDANKLAKRVRAAGSYQTTSRVSRGNSFYGSSNRAQRRYQPYNRNKTPFFEKGRFPTTKKKGTSSK